MNKDIIAFSYLFLTLATSSCMQKKSSYEAKQESRYKIYKGELNVAADPGLEPIIRQQEEVFNYYYDSVKTNIQYKIEKDMFDDFRNRKSTLLLLTRPLEKREVDELKNEDTIYIRELPVAYDAVALIGSRNFNDSFLDTEMLKKYFNPSNSSSGSPRLVFENQNSSIVRYVVNYLGYKEKVSPNVYAMKSAEEVINYVEGNNNVIGFIPFNLLSDTDDERVKGVMKRIKILSLRAKSREGTVIRVSANQSDIAEGIYPLGRIVNTVTRYTYDDNLELLLVNFLSREKGARIFLKAGLVPVKIPEREIIVNENQIKGGD